ncbi:MAG TPA: FHA domain-containing protein [Armatimonadota bacterium]|nr:FHA domain-containing protein [Armatimonadota bacterium]
MYEYLPPVLRYGVLVALYLFLFAAYRALCRGTAPRFDESGPPRAASRPAVGTIVIVGAGSTSSARVGQQVPLLTTNVLGRDPGCQVVVEDQFASKRHAAIDLRDGVYVLADLGSKNGTLLNGRPLEAPTELLDGDRIRIGSTVLEYRAQHPL